MAEWQELDSTPGLARLDADGLRAALADASKLWLAHDGLWFLAWEKRFGIESAMEGDTEAWQRFAGLEAQRIMKRLGVEPGSGVDELAECLRHRLYANMCRFTLHRRGENELKIRMNNCRVQDARNRKGLEPFPCKSVGIVEFSTFASTVNPEFSTECIQCPPDECTPGGWCEWTFKLP